MSDLEDIGKMNWGEEGRVAVEHKIDEMRGRVSVGGENTDKN